MRYAIYALAALQIAALIFSFAQTVLHPSDAAGQGMAYGFLTIGAVLLAVVLIPAFILARSDKWGWLGLVCAAVPVAAAVWLNAI